MKSAARFFNIPEKFLTPETYAKDIQRTIAGGKTAYLFKAKREEQAIGFKWQGGKGSPFKRFCRYTYPQKMKFSSAFKTGKAHLIDEVDVYPDGIIAVRSFSGSEKIFVTDDLDEDGIKITREEFDKTQFALKKMAI